jgi:hypothetical protein
MPKARCYMEYCCNAATEHLVVADRSGLKRPAIVWGWCPQHAHHAVFTGTALR